MRFPSFFAGLLVLGACGTSTDPEGVPPLLTQLPRELSPAELRIVDGANRFTFDLVRQSAKDLRPDSNLFLSPLSASMALGMTLNGANGDTYTQMQAALRLTGLTEPEINQGYRDLIALLHSLDSRTEMQVANSMWARDGFQMEPAFVETGQTFFDAEIRSLDFSSASAVPTINDWVSDKTNDRIPKLLESISREEILFLINAIYFKGKWRSQFDPKNTQQGPFHGADGREYVAQLMYQQEDLRYQENNDYQAADLLYGNGAFAMTVLLPKSGCTPGDLLPRLDPEAWRTLTGQFYEVKLSLTLPRFRMEYTRRLNQDLQALGMKLPFDEGRADLYRIADVRPDRLFITRVDQKTFVEVNEEGTEAAAATAVGIGVTSAPQVVEMRVDRPFVFAIRERLSGTVLFLGIMNTVGD